MKNLVEKYLSSFTTSIVLLSLFALGLAIATLIEKYFGTPAAKTIIYYSTLFFFLQFLLVVNFIVSTLKHKFLRKGKWGLIITHFSFIIILTGALTTFLFGEDGLLHIREGEKSNEMVVRLSKNKTTVHTLPFTVELKDFILKRYPGSSSPSSYESEVIVHVDGKQQHERIFMNNILDVKGYRFFQASYDQDEKGTILSVNRDVAGRTITYTGYFFLLVGLILSLLGRDSRFMNLVRKFKNLKTAVIIVSLFAGGVLSAQAGNDTSMKEVVMRYPINAQHAEQFGSLVIQASNGRMMPINTFSSEILRKLHKSDKFGYLNSDQFLLSVLVMPDMWMRVPFISYSNKDIASSFGLTEDECSYIQMFDEKGGYKLQKKLDEAYNKMPVDRNHFDKDLMKLDEQVNILHQLLNYQMLNIFPKSDDPNLKWYAPGDDLSGYSGKDSVFVTRIAEWYLSAVQASLKSGDWSEPDEVLGMINTYQQAKGSAVNLSPERIKAEVTYNKLEIFRYCKIGYLVSGGLLIFFLFLFSFKNPSWKDIVIYLLQGIILFVFCYHMYGMGMRWYIGGYAPWSNSYETMVYVSWATVLAGLLFSGKSKITFGLATLFGGIILFVSGLNWMDPEINPLVPVLKSPWLMFHVAVIVAAYGFFGISCLIGLTNMAMMSFRYTERKQQVKSRIKELSIINEMALWVGLALMTVGIFLGAVWANESWGRYWGWDPKETWALITMVIYAIVTHSHLIPKMHNSWCFNFLSVISFSTVLMTFFGVNYFLSGMHSYGQNDNLNGLFLYLNIAVILIFILSLVSYKGWKRL